MVNNKFEDTIKSLLFDYSFEDSQNFREMNSGYNGIDICEKNRKEGLLVGHGRTLEYWGSTNIWI